MAAAPPRPASAGSPASHLALPRRYTGELLKVATGYLTLRLCKGDRSHSAYRGDAAARPYTTCGAVATIAQSTAFSESATTSYEVPADADFGRYYFRADSIASRDDDGDYSAQSAYTLVWESATVVVADDYPTPAPSLKPTESTTDSSSWYKTGAPSKDCAWVASYLKDGEYVRCRAKGDDGSYAYDACAETCAGYTSR